MRTIIVEDEEPILQLMKIIMSKNKYIDIIGAFTSSEEALKNIIELSPEVVFVDIEMPHMDGMSLAKEIMKFNDDIQIVFVTAYKKYALEAFKVNAVNYILKPITEEELDITVNRLLKKYNVEENKNVAKGKNKIFSLGCFKIYGNLDKEAIKWPTEKTKELFAIFVYMQGKEIDKWRLCDILWPESDPKKAEHNLHSTIYRIKTALKNLGIENVVRYEKGKYSIDFKDFYCDTWDFQAYIDNNPIVNEENIYNYEKNMDKYIGKLFGNEDFGWCIELKEKLERYYAEASKNIAKYYIKKKIYDKAEEYLKKVIKADAFDEEAQELMMMVYFYVRDKTALINHYKSLNTLFKEELGTEPKNSTNELYKSLLYKL
ncbi:response regulator [Clostridium sp. 19966]|uniref:response regulator n=1 Tax=Clostridium sp. 19966 TaxID=2768166 RepID=UPI0028DFC810|nr:response regulator [Clostridium sp. 19966]MDT8715086.1 response regulator [Clostridium sp. 19966]